jgi:hypothetical protein
MQNLTDPIEVLDRLLDPVGRILTPEAAQQLVDLRADPVAQARIDQLADRNTEGRLSPTRRPVPLCPPPAATLWYT